VLTDYHVHLRPDDDGTPAADYFTTANAERYRTVAEERGITELGVAEHIHRFTQSLDIWQHPWWQKWARDDVDAYCEFVREETDLRLGIEADFVAGREDRLANFLDAREWDYVVGSVHFVANEAVDMEDFSVWGRGESAEKVWRRYFETVGEAARTGMFDIMAHPDLVKVGHRRAGPERRPAALLRARDRGLPRRRRCCRGLDRRAAQAGRRDLPGAELPRGGGRRGAADRALERRAHRRPARLPLRRRARAARAGRRDRDLRVRGPRAAARADRLTMRSGIGIDTHRFEDGRPLILGGVEIPSERGLAGHSDADVLTHAIVDALLGAAALGDIGEHFPDTDELWRNADSMALLRTVLERVTAAGWAVDHVDATVVLERPKLAPHRDAIRESLASVLGSVNVKFTTGEKMGFVGREEGAAALAVATLAPVVSP
jgi:2-C-methyl-D-erythritol 2,4-cyclodiphosphate synthase